MALFSYALHSLGLQGMRRRTWLAMASYGQPEWGGMTPLIGIGGIIMFISAMLYFLDLVLRWVASREPAPRPAGIRRGVLRA